MTYTIYNQKFGFELEFSGITRTKAIKTLSEVLGVEAPYYSNEVYDQQGRKWKIVRDGSINPYLGGDQNELVSPPLTYDDMDLVQEIVRALRRAGAKVDSSCGMHVHIDLQPYNAKSLKNLIKFYSKYEHMFYKSCNVLPSRKRYARELNEKHPRLVKNINKVNSIDALKKLWYGNEYSGSSMKYHDSRYAGLNLHNIWYKGWLNGTIEFRLFNASLHAGEVRTYITLALAISAKALNANSINMRTNRSLPDDVIYSNVLVSLGITSRDEKMKNVYKHLMKHMRAS